MTYAPFVLSLERALLLSPIEDVIVERMPADAILGVMVMIDRIKDLRHVIIAQRDAKSGLGMAPRELRERVVVKITDGLDPFPASGGNGSGSEFFGDQFFEQGHILHVDVLAEHIAPDSPAGLLIRIEPDELHPLVGIRDFIGSEGAADRPRRAPVLRTLPSH